MTTNKYIRGVKEGDWLPFRKKLWQRNYYEHVIRDEEELNRLRQYISENSANWQTDEENPDATP
jgi:REP element-mobilizing transposase RayT